jgi:polyhydroxyalkanoate synthesis regulator phasin
MLDVHPPHGKIHGVGDFFLHLFTITVGLLIALALEGCVERQHQRHIVHEAEAGMRREIEENSKQIGSLRQQVADETKQLDEDLAVLNELKGNPKERHKQLAFTFRMQGFDDVTWKTAQTTGALGLMPYGDAEVYAGIYGTQVALEGQQKEIVDDVMRAASLGDTKKEGEQPTASEISLISERIGLVQLRLLLLNSYIDGLEKTYKKFEAEHAGA